MHFVTLRVGYGTNCYIVINDNDAVVIDPGAQGKRISKVLTENNLSLKAVFLTHGHFDHISGLKDLLTCRKEKFDIWISEIETKIEEYPYKQDLIHGLRLSYWEDKEIVQVGTMSFYILQTPGHSPGSVCILIDDLMFSGDTFFKSFIGRTDFVGCDKQAMIESLLRISKIEKNYHVLPGHEGQTSLQEEIRNNPYFRALKLAPSKSCLVDIL